MTTDTAPRRHDSRHDSRHDPAERYDRFVDAVQKTCRDPGRRAALRSGLRRLPEDAHRMHAALPWRLIPDDLDGDEERAYYTVAALIAAQPRPARDDEANNTDANNTDASDHSEDKPAAHHRPDRRPNLGATFARAVFVQAMKDGTAETRLHLLARQHTNGIHRHLPAVVRYLRAEQVDLDWARLLSDLTRWAEARDRVAKEWLQSYYRALARYDAKAAKNDTEASGHDAAMALTNPPETNGE